MSATYTDKYHDYNYKMRMISHRSFQYEININGNIKFGKTNFTLKIY